MEDLLLSHSATVYGCSYFAAIAAVTLWEARQPRRVLTAPLRQRWMGNFALALINNALAWAIFPVLGFAFATFVSARGWGLFNQLVSPYWIAIALSWFLLDLGKYAQHYLFHHIPLLWRVHIVHHSDLDYDFTTGLRFHPVEWLIISAIDLAIIAALGVAPVAYLIYQVVGAVVAILSHGNVWLSPLVDRTLRRLLVTPDMHRVHHSTVRSEANSNYGSTFPWWDRGFGTYVDQPIHGHEMMTVGVAEIRDLNCLSLGWALRKPFAG